MKFFQVLTAASFLRAKSSAKNSLHKVFKKSQSRSYTLPVKETSMTDDPVILKSKAKRECKSAAKASKFLKVKQISNLFL